MGCPKVPGILTMMRPIVRCSGTKLVLNRNKSKTLSVERANFRMLRSRHENRAILLAGAAIISD
jgi:hypothetical protein